MKKVTIGFIGSGFVTGLHMWGYNKVSGIDVKIKAVASRKDEVTEAFVKKHGIQDVYEDYLEMLKDPEIDVIDICTPPFLHEEMVRNCLQAGKHVICEKPLTGYFGDPASDINVGEAVPKAKMLEEVTAELNRIKEIADACDKQFMYAENWVYAPVVQKSAEVIAAAKSKILYMYAVEGHNGSHAHHAANWKFNGGGALIRQGCHPLAAALFLKQVEAKARGEVIKPVSVIADCGVSCETLTDAERTQIDSHPVDVEDIANVIITFSDGTKAHIMAGDMLVGGMRNSLDVYTNNSVHHCKMNPNDNMMVYHADGTGLDDVYFAEKLGTKLGWQYVGINEEIQRGYAGEMQDFMECVAENRRPLADINIAYDATKIVYAAYQSAAEGRRIEL